MVSAWNCIRGNSGISESGCGSFLSVAYCIDSSTGKVEFQGKFNRSVAKACGSGNAANTNGVSRPHACLNPLMTVGIADRLFTSWQHLLR